MEKFTYRDNVMKKLDNSGEKLWMLMIELGLTSGIEGL